MKKLSQSEKSTKYLLTNYNGIKIFLYVPSSQSKEQKYYLDYNCNGQKKYYGKGEVKKKAIDYLTSIQEKKGVSEAFIEAQLKEIYKEELDVIINELSSFNLPTDIRMNSNFLEVIDSFYHHKEIQHKEGTVGKVSLYNYYCHHCKLKAYFSQKIYLGLVLADLSSAFWLTYRLDMLANKYKINRNKPKNSSVNLHFQYITQFYSWLIDYLELPIKNHLKKLKKLNEAQQGKRFKIIPDTQLIEFYGILEGKEKYEFTRLYLAALLLYENNIRLSEQVLIRVSDIDVKSSTIRILNKKNDSVRTVIVSDKVAELIQIIRTKTIARGYSITDDMFLIGGHNTFKKGIPHGQKELGVIMRRFRKKYPQFNNRTLYEHKHTSITHQFNRGIDTYQIKERANHSSISTTEIYLQGVRMVEPYTLKLTELE